MSTYDGFCPSHQTHDNNRRSLISSSEYEEELERAREANRVHCKETRDRRKERERLLREVFLLKDCECMFSAGTYT